MLDTMFGGFSIPELVEIAFPIEIIGTGIYLSQCQKTALIPQDVGKTPFSVVGHSVLMEAFMMVDYFAASYRGESKFT